MVLAVRRRAFLVVRDHLVGAHALGADLLDAEDTVELVQAPAEVGSVGRAGEGRRPGHSAKVTASGNAGRDCPLPRRPGARHTRRSVPHDAAMTALTLLQA